MIRLLEARTGTLRPLLPPGRNLGAWHAALVAELARLSPAHAAILAQPVPTPGGTAWETPGQGRIAYADLSAENRRALDQALGAILSDIRRLAESGTAPSVREAWPALREVPDMGHVFAVDGRPVLAAWGHASTGAPGRLARLDDGIAWAARGCLPTLHEPSGNQSSDHLAHALRRHEHEARERAAGDLRLAREENEGRELPRVEPERREQLVHFSRENMGEAHDRVTNEVFRIHVLERHGRPLPKRASGGQRNSRSRLTIRDLML